MASQAERAMSFGAIAADYDRLRPGPPDAAVDWLLPVTCPVAVDVGAGTGLLTRALAARAGQVVAVEPDERMRDVLRARSPGVRVLPGRGEAIPLPDASADGVFVSSAWHWLDPETAVPEIARVLRDGGRLGVIWTGLDREAGWPRLLARPGRPDPPQDTRPRSDRRRAVTLPEGAPLAGTAAQSFPFTRSMSVTDLADLMGTYSGIITAAPRDRAGWLADARTALAEQFGAADQVDVPMRSWCWRADRLARAAERRGQS